MNNVTKIKRINIKMFRIERAKQESKTRAFVANGKLLSKKKKKQA